MKTAPITAIPIILCNIAFIIAALHVIVKVRELEKVLQHKSDLDKADSHKYVTEYSQSFRKPYNFVRLLLCFLAPCFRFLTKTDKKTGHAG